MNRVSTVAEFCDKSPKGTFGIIVQTRTVPSMRKTGNLFEGRVTKVTTYTNPVLGVSYENCVKSRLNKAGLSPEFTSSPLSGTHWISSYMLESDKHPEVQYLRLTKCGTMTTVTSTYYVDGREATPEEVAIIKTFEDSHHGSAKQESAGLKPEEQVWVVNPKVDNILSLQQGDLLYVKA